jgi:hypothetical protein
MYRRLIYFTHFILFLLIIHTNVTYGFDPRKDPNLVGFWKLDDGSGTTVTDSSPRGNIGTFVGAPQWVEGYRGGGLYLNGTNAAVQIATPLNLYSNHVTITAWVKRNGEQSTWAAFVFTRAGGSVAGIGHSETVELRYHWNDATWGFSSGLEPPDGEWFFAALVIEPTQGTIYLNEQTSVNATNHDIEEFGGPLFIGEDPQGGRFFNGTIDEVAIFNRSLTKEELKIVMIGISPALASDPSPVNEETDVIRDVVLGWTPGVYAQTHDVYFGTVFEDVNNADRTNQLGVLAGQDQNAETYIPGRLGFDQTYYWRIDEVNAPPENTIFKGDIWSFTTEPYVYPIPTENIIATASSSVEGQGPEQTINGSGLDINDLHSKKIGDMWISGPGDPGSAWIQYEFDKPYKLLEMLIWNYNGDTILSLYGIKEVTIEYSADGVNWTQSGISELAQASGAEGYAANTTVPFDGSPVKYIKVTANNNFIGGIGVFNQYGLSEVRFTYIPVSARNPAPANEATGVAIDTSLNWRPGREAAQHQVYLDTDQQAVIDGAASIGTVDQPVNGPLSLDLSTLYYWRVDEVNSAEAVTTWPGSIWSFTTEDYLVVDDFESYNDIPEGQEGSHLVYGTWTDGYANPAANGSTIGYPSGMSMETEIVHGGDQAVPLIYDNTTATKSEVTVDPGQLPIGRNWSKGSPQALVLWIHGDPTNATSELYVKIGNAKAVFDGDISRPLWMQWIIDLTTLGANLNDVTAFTIGLERTGGSGGTGTILIDDIRLYGVAPVPVEEIFLEAEVYNSIQAPMTVYNDPNASGGKYVMKDPAAAASTASPPANGLVTYSFTVTGGTYTLAGRVITSGTNDSFWLRIPGATTQTTNHTSGWIQWNGITVEGNWGWEQVWSSNDNGTVVEFTMPAGTYTLELKYRENASQIDAWLLTKID